VRFSETSRTLGAIHRQTRTGKRACATLKEARRKNFFHGGETEMPDVHILWLAGRTVDQKRKVVEGITKVLMEEAGAKPESTHIVFVDIPHTDFASGGMLVADKNKKT
jgi:4-oxalocrotonate tautomerase